MSRLNARLGCAAVLLLVLTGCSQRDMSIQESCDTYDRIVFSAVGADDQVYETMREDLLAAEPRMHESVARHARIAVDIYTDPDASIEAYEAFARLRDLCPTPGLQ